jgi:copper(I)-binding protein
MIAKLVVALCAALSCTPLLADSVKVSNPWTRATAPGQAVAGAFMELTASADMTLVGARSPAAKTAELHTMSMDKGVMSMRQVKKIDLPKGKTVSLKPGGLHLMLIDLNAPLQAAQNAQITLIVNDRLGKTSEIAVAVPVRAVADMPGAAHQHH